MWTPGEISSGSTTTHFDASLLDYEAFYFDDDHVKEISSGSPTTQSDISLSEYDSFIFDFAHEEFVDELAHIISLPDSEVKEIVIPEVGGIDDDIPLTIKDDNLRENLLNVNLLIPTIEALNDNPTPSSDCKTKSSSTSLNSLLEETNTFHNSLPEFKTSTLI
nr:hypothetical protein [Tanacetum cinerariifolium]